MGPAGPVTWGLSLGEYLKLWPHDSLLIPTPGIDGRVAGAGRDEGVPAPWCARVSRPVASAHGPNAEWRVYFFLVPPEGDLPTSIADPAGFRAEYCRLGLVALEVAGADGDAVPGRSFEQRIGEFGTQGLDKRRGGEVWPDGPAGCMDAKYGFYGPGGGTIHCLAAFAIDTQIAVSSRPNERGRANEFERYANPDFLRAGSDFFNPGDRALLDSILHPPTKLLADPTHDTIPLDDPAIERLARFRGRLRAYPAPDQAIGFAWLDYATSLALRAYVFGWPPRRQDSPEAAAIEGTGADIVLSESDFDWLYSHNWLDSAESRHRGDELGDSLYAWSIGSSGGCMNWGGSRFGVTIDRTRVYTLPGRSAGVRAIALENNALFWSDSLEVAPAEEAPALRDSVVGALEALVHIAADSSTRALAREGLWRARAGLVPLAPNSSCEAVD